LSLQRLHLEGQLDVGLHGDERAPVGSQSFTRPQVSPTDALDLVGMRDHALERSRTARSACTRSWADLVDAGTLSTASPMSAR
jgi:hypothetical protein